VIFAPHHSLWGKSGRSSPGVPGASFRKWSWLGPGSARGRVPGSERSQSIGTPVPAPGTRHPCPRLHRAMRRHASPPPSRSWPCPSVPQCAVKQAPPPRTCRLREERVPRRFFPRPRRGAEEDRRPGRGHARGEYNGARPGVRSVSEVSCTSPAGTTPGQLVGMKDAGRHGQPGEDHRQARILDELAARSTSPHRRPHGQRRPTWRSRSRCSAATPPSAPPSWPPSTTSTTLGQSIALRAHERMWRRLERERVRPQAKRERLKVHLPAPWDDAPRSRCYLIEMSIAIQSRPAPSTRLDRGHLGSGIDLQPDPPTGTGSPPKERSRGSRAPGAAFQFFGLAQRQWRFLFLRSLRAIAALNPSRGRVHHHWRNGRHAENG